MENNQQELFQPLAPHEMAGRLMNKKAIQDYVFAGKATFTIRNNLTGRHFTFRLKEDHNHPGKFWVDSLRGPSLYQAVGKIIGDGKLYYLPFEYENKKKRAIEEHHERMKAIPFADRVMFDLKAWNTNNLPLSVKSFMWFMSKYKSAEEFSDNIEIWHEGVCGRCGRTLTHPDSIESGFGTECIKWVVKMDRQQGLRL